MKGETERARGEVSEPGIDADAATPKVALGGLRRPVHLDGRSLDDARVGFRQRIATRRVKQELLARVERRPVRVDLGCRVIVWVVALNETLEAAGERSLGRDRVLAVPDHALVPRDVAAVRRCAVVKDALPGRRAERFCGPVCLRMCGLNSQVLCRR